jgi:DNA-binding MarR family transcriptional regulator
MKKSQIPMLPCMCANLRRAARAVTQFYGAELRPTGLSSTQFTILQTLSIAGNVTQGQLGELLSMDSTSLTRTLAIMGRNGWIEKRRGKDRREWRLQLSSAGEEQLAAALPYWENAQSRLRKLLGRSQSSELSRLSNLATSAVTLTPAVDDSGDA